MPTKPIEGSPPTPIKPAAPEKEIPKPAPSLHETEKSKDKGSKKEGPPAGKIKEVVLFGQSKESGPKAQRERETLRVALNEIATEKYGKSSYGELGLSQKLSALEEHLTESKEISAPTREAIHRLKDIIASPPEPDQLNEMKKEFAKLPQSEDFYSIEMEIQRKMREGAVGYVVAHQREYGVDRQKISKFSGEIGETSVGQVPYDFKFYDDSLHYADVHLKAHLQEAQETYDMLGYTRSTPTAIEQEIIFKQKALDELLAKTRGPDAFDKDEARSIIRSLNADVEWLTNEKGKQEAFLYNERIESRELSNYPPRNAGDLIGRVENEMGARYRVNAEHVHSAYDRLPTPEEKKAFEKHAIRRIRARLEELEEYSEVWRLDSVLDDRVQEITSWLNIIKSIDQEKWKHIHAEVEGRNWLHAFYQTLRQGSSPMDTKDLMHPMQAFDKMEIREAISNMPGVWKAHQLLERDYDKLLAAETNPEEWRKVYNGIINEIEHTKVLKDPEDPNSPLIPLLDPSEGISARTAVETAYRHFHETGRDAQRYALYMEKNECIRLRKRKKDGKEYTSYEVDPHAPQLWNAFRLTYYSKAMWSFFQYGSNMQGVLREITVMVPDGRGGFKEKPFGDVQMGQGVGADAMEALLNYGYSPCLTDFYSRRNGPYIIQAWIDEQVRVEQGMLQKNPDYTMKAAWEKDHELYFRNKNKIQGPAELAQAENEYAEFFGRRALEYSRKNKIPVSGAVFNPYFMEKIAAVDGDTVTAINDYERTMVETYGEDYRKKYKNGSQEIIPNMEHFDIREIPWGSILRNQENVRGNFRDHFAGLQVNELTGKFIVDPTIENLEQFDWHIMGVYTEPQNVQQHWVLPGYLTLIDMNRGGGPLGGEMFGLVKSKLGEVRDVPPIDDKQAYEVGRWLVAQGGLSKDMLRRVRGGFPGLLRDKALEYADPISILLLNLAIISELKQRMEKDSKGT